ncbi:hypothetical protein M378DRAFT_179137 [Amanita muscaria Koide BX008]|uniref:Uncharacterized protein n=1 Tax=Amanita muscaria (strain Koide BX008) TaxID=946122 RepID=A0A0C2SKD8_AMAMK|nr:hypothetical protein M378DRAFT_179137 [Amanita muscaria Koide BX008]
MEVHFWSVNCTKEKETGVTNICLGTIGTAGGRLGSSTAQLGILKAMIPPAAPPPAIPPPPIHLKRRDLSSPITHLELLEKRRRKGKGGPDKSPSLFKSVAGAIGTAGGRLGSSTAQLGILKKMIPPAPPPPPTPQQPGQSPPKPVSPPSPPPSHPPSPPPSPPPPPPPPPPPASQSPFIPPAVPPFPHFPPSLPPPVPHVRRRSLSRPIGRLDTFEKRRMRRRGGADKTPSMFKSVSGAVGTMGGPPVQRRDLSRPVALNTGGNVGAFAPGLLIKNAFSRVGQPPRVGVDLMLMNLKTNGKPEGLIAFFDGVAKGFSV